MQIISSSYFSLAITVFILFAHAALAFPRPLYPPPISPELQPKPEDANATAGLFRRDIVSQTNHFLHLVSISRPRGSTTFQYPYKYTYDSLAGEGITVYSVDTGANTDNPEYKSLYLEPRWLFPATVPEGHDSLKNDPLGHGTCVMSLIAGKTYGVAKKVQLVIVKVAFPKARGTDYWKNIEEALDLVYKDIIERKLEGKANVNLSVSWSKDALDKAGPQTSDKLKQQIQLLTTVAGVFVAAGNTRSKEGFSTSINRYPAVLAAEIPGMSVVSAARWNGYPAKYTKLGPETALWAVGNCECASGLSSSQKNGTSFATPLATGLAAYLMAFPDNGLPAPDGSDRFAVALKQRMQAMSAYQPESREPRGCLEGKPLINNQPLPGCSPPTFVSAAA